MIQRETVERILDAARIEDVVGDFVTLKRRGANYVACCPFHNEKTPSFYVSPAKGIYKCFGCGKSGSAVGFVMEHETLSYTEALRYLAAKYRIEVVEKEETAEEIAQRQRNESLLLVSEFAAKFFRDALKSPEGESVGMQYFLSRGLERETIERFGLGWAPSGRNALAKAAREAGYKEEYLIDTGLCVKRDDGSLSDRFYDRIVFPIQSVSGRVIAFGCRTLRTDKVLAKYVNSPETELYVKSKTLYGLNFAKNEIARRDKCLLVEGYMDVISMHQLGITNVVASSGTSLTVEQIRLIRKFTENVTIIYDGDSAGIHAALRGIGMVLKEGLNVKVVLLPDGDDPDSYSRKHTLAEVSEFIDAHERDFIGFKTDLLIGESAGDPLKKANLINDIADTIAMIPDAVKRSVYVEDCASKFNIEPQILFDRIASSRREMLVSERKQQERDTDRAQAAEGGAGGQMAEETVQKEEEPSSEISVFNDPFLEPCERELLGFVLNYGQEPLKFDRDSELYTEEYCSVADFIDGCLADDDEEFINDIYRDIFEEYFEYYQKGIGHAGITSMMMNGEDRKIADAVADIMIPKHVLTIQNYIDSMTAEESMLAMYVPKAVLAYKARRMEKRMNELINSLSSASETEAEEIMREMSALHATRNGILKRLGRGIANK